MEIKDTYRGLVNSDIDRETAAIANLGEESRGHKVDKETGSEGKKRPVFWKGNVALRDDRIFRQNDVKHRHGA